MAFLAAVAAGRRPVRHIALLMTMTLVFNFSLAAVQDVALPRIECPKTQLDVLDGYGNSVWDGYAQSILIGHERECKLVVGDGELPLLKWAVAD